MYILYIYAYIYIYIYIIYVFIYVKKREKETGPITFLCRRNDAITIPKQCTRFFLKKRKE